jgi:hypothetical protein
VPLVWLLFIVGSLVFEWYVTRLEVVSNKHQEYMHALRRDWTTCLEYMNHYKFDTVLDIFERAYYVITGRKMNPHFDLL